MKFGYYVLVAFLYLVFIFTFEGETMVNLWLTLEVVLCICFLEELIDLKICLFVGCIVDLINLGSSPRSIQGICLLY